MLRKLGWRIDVRMENGQYFVSGRPLHQRGSPTNSTPYDATLATKMVWYAGAAYCDGGSLTKWACGKPCEELPDFNVTSIHNSEDYEVFGYVGYDAKLASIIVSYRGTDPSNIKNWAENLDAIQTHPFKDMPAVAVHDGFYKAYAALKDGVMVSIQTLLGVHGPKTGVWLTGHSLGASMATIMALELESRYGINVNGVIHFGSPRTGNYPFHYAVTQHVRNVWRVTHADDLVPHVPLEDMGYYHAQSEIFYPSSSFDGKYVVCNHSGEDPACSNRCASSLACTSIDNHLHYLGIPLSRSCNAHSAA